MAGGQSRCTGRVEYYDKGQWGTVCSESWDVNDASVVCRQLDCGRTHKITTTTEYGHGTGHSWINQIECNGMESTLPQCPQRPFRDQTCNTTSIAGVVCTGKKTHKTIAKDNSAMFVVIQLYQFYMFSIMSFFHILQSFYYILYIT